MANKLDIVLPTSNQVVAINPAIQLPLRLNEINYPSWRVQFQSFLSGYHLEGYIDGSLPCPSPAITNPNDDSVTPNPAYHLWKMQDGLLFNAILQSSSDNISPLLGSARSAAEAWSRLESFYSRKSPKRVMGLQNMLANTTKNNWPVGYYMQVVKQISETLALAGSPMSDKELILATLKGLGPEFKNITEAINARKSLITFEDLYGELADHELFLKYNKPTQDMTPNAAQCDQRGRGGEKRVNGKIELESDESASDSQVSEEVEEEDEELAGAKIPGGKEKSVAQSSVSVSHAEPSTTQRDHIKEKEKVNEANEVKMDLAEDNAAAAESLDSTRPYAESSTAQLRRVISKGKEKEEVNEANEVTIDVAGDNAAEALDSPRPYAESSTAQHTIIKVLSPVKKAKPKCFIHVVHDGLKQPGESDMHYKPLLLSIGPYHHQNHFLQNMLKHKVHYSEVLLGRKKESSCSRYTKALKNEGVDSKALDCYMDTFRMTRDDFGECLVLDGLFMLGLFQKNLRPAEYEKVRSNDGDDKDMLFSTRWMKPCLARDLLLLENQLPLFVLYKLYEMTEDWPSKMEFIELALRYFEFSGRPITIDMNLTDQLDDIPHLLGLVYHALVPEMPNQSNKEWESREFIRTAVALQEVGIKLEKEGSEKSKGLFGRIFESWFELFYCSVFFHKNLNLHSNSLLKFLNQTDPKRFYDISFSRKDGELKIPRLVIDDNTESFFRNLVAYEQYSEDYSLHRVTDYLRVMDCLINTAKDVELLRHCGIIDNRTGDDAKVSTMFNKLCTGVYFDQNEFLYAEMFDQVNEFCKKPCNVRMAKLKNDYFGSPWSVISFFAATTLLVLTILQTVFAGISTF